MFRAEVVLVAPGTSAEGLLDGDDLTEALADAGWPDEDGSALPSAGALYTLRQELS